MGRRIRERMNTGGAAAAVSRVRDSAACGEREGGGFHKSQKFGTGYGPVRIAGLGWAGTSLG